MRNACWKLLYFAACFGVKLGAANREYQRLFPVAPGCELKIDAYRGQILIAESDRHEVDVQVSLDAVAEEGAAAMRLLDQVRVEMGREDNRVTIMIRNPSESGLRFDWDEEAPVDVQLRLSVPRHCHVDLRAIQGRAEIGNLSGRITVRIENGGVFLRRIEGAVTVHLDQGDFVLSRCTGPVTARVLRGLIRVGTIGGRAELANATGDIEVMAVRHSLVAEAEVGVVRVGFAPGLAADSRVRVAAGELFARFHAKTACRLDAAATWGRVNSDLPLAIESGASGARSLTGRLNGGGPLVQLRASGGSVTIERGLLLVDED
jgi:hypothetical protein